MARRPSLRLTAAGRRPVKPAAAATLAAAAAAAAESTVVGVAAAAARRRDRGGGSRPVELEWAPGDGGYGGGGGDGRLPSSTVAVRWTSARISYLFSESAFF
jgi:hypothetical protein